MGPGCWSLELSAKMLDRHRCEAEQAALADAGVRKSTPICHEVACCWVLAGQKLRVL